MNLFRLANLCLAVLRSLLVGLIIVMCILAAIFITAPSEEIEFLSNTSEVYEYSIKRTERGLGRVQAIGKVHKFISRNIVTTIFGLGPGSITPVTTSGEDTEFRKSHRDLFIHYSSYTYHTIELGYGGLLVFLYLFYRILSFSNMFSKKIQDPFWRAISIGLSGITFTSVYSIIYTPSWIYPPLPFCVWFLSGALCRIAYLRGISLKG